MNQHDSRQLRREDRSARDLKSLLLAAWLDTPRNCKFLKMPKISEDIPRSLGNWIWAVGDDEDDEDDDSWRRGLPLVTWSLVCAPRNATYWRSKRVEWMEKSQGAEIVLYRGGLGWRHHVASIGIPSMPAGDAERQEWCRKRHEKMAWWFTFMSSQRVLNVGCLAARSWNIWNEGPTSTLQGLWSARFRPGSTCFEMF